MTLAVKLPLRFCKAAANVPKDAISRRPERVWQYIKLCNAHLQGRRRAYVLVWSTTAVGTVNGQRWDRFYHVRGYIYNFIYFHLPIVGSSRYEKTMDALDKFDPERRIL